MLEGATRDDGHVEPATVPGDDGRLLGVEPLREVGQHLALRLVLADNAEAFGQMVLEQEAAKRDDLVIRRRGDPVAVVQPRQLGIRDGLDVEHEMRGHENLALPKSIVYRGMPTEE